MPGPDDQALGFGHYVSGPCAGAACMEKGLPIGCAPGINVSLVLLPEECRSLSRRRFPAQTLKLKLLKAAVGRMMSRRLAAAS